MLKTYLFIIIILLNIATLSAQVNTEKFKFQEQSEGLNAVTSLSVDWEDGNSRDTEYTAGFGLNHTSSLFSNYLIGYLSYKEGQGTVYKNEGYLYLASTVLLNDVINPEIFLQTNFHKYILLKERYLGGIHARISMLDIKGDESEKSVFIINLGVGAMYEYELIDATPEYSTETIRSTNLLNIFWQIHKKISLYTTTYFQFEYDRLHNHRILNDFIMEFEITDNFSISTNIHYRFDNEPPEQLKKFDVEVIQGFNYKFSIN